MARISFEQKETKETKEEFFFVAFVCFCANSVPWALRLEDSESVKSVKSAVPFLRLRPPAARLPAVHYGAGRMRKCLMMRALHESAFFRVFSLTILA